MTTLIRRLLCTLFIFLILGGSVGKAQSLKPYFLPDDGTEPIINLFKAAQHTIYVVAYVITDSAITNALLNASHRGVEVKVLLDEQQAKRSKYSQHRILFWGPIEIRLFLTRSGRLISDFGIIDNNIVYTGGALLHTIMRANPK